MNAQLVHQVRNQQIGFVFQFHHFLSELSALENILLPSRVTNQYNEKEKFARELLLQVGLASPTKQTVYHIIYRAGNSSA
jgi:ABC-type lipoprotein export system ATPase subunit